MDKCLVLYSLDIKAAVHRIFNELKIHPLTVSWFFFLYIAIMWIVAYDAPTLSYKSGLSLVDLYATVSVVFFILSVVWLKQHLLETNEIFVTSPITDIHSVIAGKLMAVTLTNMILFLGSIGTYLVFSVMTGTMFAPELAIYLILLVIVINSAPAGLYISILASNIGKKNILMALLPVIFYAAIYFIYTAIILFPVLAVITVVEWIIAVKLVNEIPVKSDIKNIHTTTISRLPLPGILKRDHPLSAGIELNWKVVSRKKEHLSIIFSSVVILIGMILFYHFGNFQKLSGTFASFPLYLYKKGIIISGTIYLGAVVFASFDGLFMLSKDGKALWQFITVSKLSTLIFSRTYVLIFLSMLYVPFVVLPLSIILYNNIIYILYWCFTAVAVILVLSSFGIWSAVNYLNQTIHSGGSPSVLILYNVFFFSLLFSAIVEALSFYFFSINHIAGILFALFLSEWGMMLVGDSILWNSKKIERMDLII